MGLGVATVSYHPLHERRALMRAIQPELAATARRHRPVLEEWDLGAGRSVQVHPCAHCWGQRKILEPGELGLVPVLCRRCLGAGWELG